jgi:hypothetical protein
LIWKWLDVNLQLKQYEATAEAAEVCIFGFKGNQNDLAAYFRQCKHEYEDFVAGAHLRGSVKSAVKPSALDSTFDSSYWTEYKN